MADFDVFLLTSDAEGMPLVVLEALSLGIPVVSTDVGCVGELTDNVCLQEKELVLKLFDVLDRPKSKDIKKHSLSFISFISKFIEKYTTLYRK